MKSLILYGSKTKLTNAHKLVTNPCCGPKGRDAWIRLGVNYVPQPHYYVRAALVNEDVSWALEHSKPRQGEIVLNTVEIEP